MHGFTIFNSESRTAPPMRRSDPINRPRPSPDCARQGAGVGPLPAPGTEPRLPTRGALGDLVLETVIGDIGACCDSIER